jgi:hypothetical protein
MYSDFTSQLSILLRHILLTQHWFHNFQETKATMSLFLAGGGAGEDGATGVQKGGPVAG